MPSRAQTLTELAALRSDLAVAADAILFAAETGLRHAAAGADPTDIAQVHELFAAIISACAFQDITGQRLSKIEMLIKAASIEIAAGGDPLLNGPARPGDGLDQEAADAIFGAPSLGAS